MIVALNNKCNLTKEEYQSYINELNKIESNNTMILCPTYLHIPNTNLISIHLGAQNVSCRENGAYTGEVSSIQLKSYGVEYTIIGHSERREYQKETNEEINEKIKQLLNNNIKPILCIGETLEERKNNKVFEVLKEEINGALNNISEEDQKKIIIAYEPIWSIGTGLIPSIEEIEEVFIYIKNIIPNIKVLYGGSANEENINVLKKCLLIDGYLLGGLSLKPEKLQVFLDKLK